MTDKPYVHGLVGSFDKVFYYDAVSGREYRETQEAYAARVQPEHDRFERIQALDRVHVALGKIVGKDRLSIGADVRGKAWNEKYFLAAGLCGDARGAETGLLVA